VQSHAEPTLCSQARFIDAIVRAMNGSVQPLELQSSKSLSSIYGTERPFSFGRRTITLAPLGLYAHPSRMENLSVTVGDIIRQVKTWSTVNFEWNVRFDHAELAQELLKRGIPFHRSTIHTISLVEDYEAIFARFDKTARNLVRRSRREGLNVRTTHDPRDVTAYYEVYIKHRSQKGITGLRPKALFDELLKLRDDVVFVVGELSNRIVGGGWLFRDGGTLLYFHTATDPDYSRHSPGYALMDYAARLGHEEGRSVLNLGESNETSLEQYKNRWGAKPQYCWSFSWQNPMWETVQNIRSVCRRHARYVPSEDEHNGISGNLITRCRRPLIEQSAAD
jgi:GNAT superfamily N-acetyltransferase